MTVFAYAEAEGHLRRALKFRKSSTRTIDVALRPVVGARRFDAPAG